jgi:hypothetical protein
VLVLSSLYGIAARAIACLALRQIIKQFVKTLHKTWANKYIEIVIVIAISILLSFIGPNLVLPHVNLRFNVPNPSAVACNNNMYRISLNLLFLHLPTFSLQPAVLILHLVTTYKSALLQA